MILARGTVMDAMDSMALIMGLLMMFFGLLATVIILVISVIETVEKWRRPTPEE